MDRFRWVLFAWEKIENGWLDPEGTVIWETCWNSSWKAALFHTSPSHWHTEGLPWEVTVKSAELSRWSNIRTDSLVGSPQQIRGPRHWSGNSSNLIRLDETDSEKCRYCFFRAVAFWTEKEEVWPACTWDDRSHFLNLTTRTLTWGKATSSQSVSNLQLPYYSKGTVQRKLPRWKCHWITFLAPCSPNYLSSFWG